MNIPEKSSPILVWKYKLKFLKYFLIAQFNSFLILNQFIRAHSLMKRKVISLTVFARAKAFFKWSSSAKCIYLGCLDDLYYFFF